MVSSSGFIHSGGDDSDRQTAEVVLVSLTYFWQGKCDYNLHRLLLFTRKTNIFAVQVGSAAQYFHTQTQIKSEEPIHIIQPPVVML